jgi:hypothetical protein
MNEYVCAAYIHSLIVVNLMRELIDQEVKLCVEFIINNVRNLKITSPFVFPFFLCGDNQTSRGWLFAVLTS